jgi:hypothetical protein
MKKKHMKDRVLGYVHSGVMIKYKEASLISGRGGMCLSNKLRKSGSSFALLTVNVQLANQETVDGRGAHNGNDLKVLSFSMLGIFRTGKFC